MKAQFEIKGKVETVIGIESTKLDNGNGTNYRLAEFMASFEDANRKYNKKMFANITYE